jgi:bacillithiol biosynthesis cysteine-adding enzyme BshC
MSFRFQSTPATERPALDPSARIAARGAGVEPGLEQAFLATGTASAGLEKLLAGDALCVTTGQQPGLLTGPLFTVYKALTAVSLARALENALGRTVVPVFWVAGDDHDFQEANHVNLITTSNELERVELRSRDAREVSLPLYREQLGAGIEAVLHAVERTTPETEFRPEVSAWLERHYRPEADFASAFAGAIAELLGAYGLVVFSPTHETAKRAMAPYLIRVLEEADEIDRALAARAQALESSGHAVSVPVGDGSTPVLIEDRLGRDRVVVDGDSFRTRRAREPWTLDSLRSVARNEPERLSPNVLLRPAVEAALLPTLAYVAGPGELRYLPQTAPLYDALKVTPQTPVARWSALIVEARVEKVLDKYGIEAEDLTGPEGKLEGSLVEKDMPAAAAAALDAVRRTLTEEYDKLERAAGEVDPTLEKSVRSARNNALGGAASVEKRLVGHLKKRNEVVAQQIAKARTSLFPGGKPTAFVDAALAASAEAVPELESAPGKP